MFEKTLVKALQFSAFGLILAAYAMTVMKFGGVVQ